MASLRIGWGYGPVEVIAALDRIRLPFSVPRAGEAAAVAALGDGAFLARSLEGWLAGRARLCAALRALNVRTLPTATNFVTAHFQDASQIDSALEREGILVRNLSSYGMADWLRISVGTINDVNRVIEALTKICAR